METALSEPGHSQSRQSEWQLMPSNATPRGVAATTEKQATAAPRGAGVGKELLFEFEIGAFVVQRIMPDIVS